MGIKATLLRVEFRRVTGSNLLALCALLSPVVVHGAQLPPPAQREINFARDIQPIFERSCLRCHGPEKPKSGFRLDNREGALAGGDNGKTIIPGDSTNSALIQIVAGTHEDIERMPPKDKGDPLTDEEISTLRAWIDQGAPWADAAVAGAGAPGLQRQGSVTPAFRWIGVSGDEQKFREHFWIKDGFRAGLSEFVLADRLSSNATIRVDGRLWPGENDFRIALRYERSDVGFIDAGVDQFAKYYDNSGGFFRAFDPPLYRLDQDLDLEVGKAWIDFGLTLPDLPKLSVGYEYQYRKGTKSTLQWGPVRSTSLPELPEVSVVRSIYPAFKEIDEKVHILKLDLTHEFAGIFAEDNFRAEFYDLQTQRNNALSVIEGQATPAISAIVDEGHDEFRAVNALRVEKEIRPWWFVSAGYLSSTAEADATFRQTTEHATGLPISGDFWQSHAIILEQDSVLLNGSTRLGPWQDLVLSAGVQAENLRQEGMGRVSHDTGNPATFLLIQPATLDANLNKNTLRESTELRFTGLPFTSIFAEARLEQEALGNFESQIGSGQNFVSDTDSSSGMQDWRVGFYSSPLRSVSFGAHFRQRNKHTDYDNRIDTTAGYPGFIRDRRIGTDEVEAKLTWRPRPWLKATLSYQIVDTDFRSDTDAITNVTPGGPLRAGTFNADVYGLNLMLTPFSRWYFSATANYYDSRAVSSDNGVLSIVPYEGDVISVLGSATCTISTNTELTASYTFSMADYAQDNAAAGLPLGINYDWHVVQAGVTRRIRNASVNLRYAFYRYNEPTSGGFNNYTAHGVFAALTLRWP